jgi:hypothetical protein
VPPAPLPGSYVVVRVGERVRLMVPAMRAEALVINVHVPAGSVLWLARPVAPDTVAVVGEVPEAYVNGPGVDPEVFTVPVVYVKLKSDMFQPFGSIWSWPVVVFQ